MSYDQIKSAIAQLREAKPGLINGVEVRDEVCNIARAEHSNGWKAGSESHKLRTFWINGSTVSIVEAAKHITK